MRVVHSTVATLPDQEGAEINKAEWNDDHVLEGVGSAQITLGFGATENNLTSLTISAPWVTSETLLVVSVAHEATDDHSADEALAEGIIASCGNIVDGVSFDLIAFAPNCTWGEYKFNVIGL